MCCYISLMTCSGQWLNQVANIIANLIGNTLRISNLVFDWIQVERKCLILDPNGKREL